MVGLAILAYNFCVACSADVWTTKERVSSNCNSEWRLQGGSQTLSDAWMSDFRKGAGGGLWREDEEDGGKALNARQEEDGRQKPIRQPESRVPSFSQLFRPLEDQDTARNECEKKKKISASTASASGDFGAGESDIDTSTGAGLV